MVHVPVLLTDEPCQFPELLAAQLFVFVGVKSLKERVCDQAPEFLSRGGMAR